MIIIFINLAFAVGIFCLQYRKTYRISQKNIIFDQSSCAIAIHEKGSIIRVNPQFCKIFGYDPSEIDDFHLLEFVCHEFRSLVLENFKSNNSKNYFVLAKKKCGEKVHLEFSDHCYEKKRTISFIKDITHCKEVEKENEDLRQQSVQNEKLASIGSLISSVIHELNAPLTVISSYAEILSNPSINAPEGIPKKLLKASTKMKSITEQLRQVSRSSKYDPLKPVNIGSAIQSAFDIFEAQLIEKEITTKVEIASPSVQIWGNQNQIESIFQNLIANSRDAFDEHKSKKDKKIFVKMETSGNNNLHIVYCDNAGGMKKEIIEKLFTPFFTTKEAHKGTGLGMSITKSIVEKHNGVITAASIPNEGTTFNLVFPAVNTSSTKLNPPPTYPHKNKTQKIGPTKMSALIVDDQIEIIEVLEIYLADYFNTIGSINSFTALDQIKKNKFDLIITDLQMPYHSGLDIISAARIHQPKTPIIVVSGHSGKCEKANIAINKGADLILPKPFESKDMFIEAVFQVLNAKSKFQAQSLTQSQI